MNWITVIWSTAAGACLTMAAINALIWIRRRSSWENFWFAVMAIGVIGIEICPTASLYPTSPAECGQVFHWAHLVNGVVVIASWGQSRLLVGAVCWLGTEPSAAG